MGFMHFKFLKKQFFFRLFNFLDLLNLWSLLQLLQLLRTRLIFFTLLISSTFLSCSFEKTDCPVVSDKKNAAWTFVVYMASDNNLEEYAVLDMKEIERAMPSDNVNVLVLWDRRVDYDRTNEDWSDTRLFEIAHDKSSYGKNIVSRRIDCEDIGLFKTHETELNMASASVLSGVLNFAKREYPSQYLGLILWGHGSGNMFLADDDSNSAMSLSNLRIALENISSNGLSKMSLSASDGSGKLNDYNASEANWRNTENVSNWTGGRYASDGSGRRNENGKNNTNGWRNATDVNGKSILDFLGFDTCFASVLEVLYELKDCTKYFAGSPGLVKDYGWDYTSFFNGVSNCISNNNYDAKTVALLSETQFESLYSHIDDIAFSVIKMSAAKQLFNSFDDLALATAKLVTDSSKRDTLFSILFKDTLSYSASNADCSKFLSLKDFANKMTIFDASLEEASSCLLSALEDACVGTSTLEKSPAFFFCDITSFGIASAVIPSEYCKKNGSITPLLFVKDSLGYAAYSDGKNTLLDKLFYFAF